jgi:hypothetical protein
LSFVISPVDGLVIILSGAAPAGDELVVAPDEDDGAVDDVPEDGDVLGDVEDVDPGLGDVVDDEDEGATTGGLVAPVDVLDSRWQPATPTARPVQSSAINVLVMSSPIGVE